MISGNFRIGNKGYVRGLSFMAKLFFGFVLLVAAYLIFRYGLGATDWDFILDPIKAMFGK